MLDHLHIHHDLHHMYLNFHLHHSHSLDPNLHYKLQLIHHKRMMLGYIGHRHNPINLGLHMMLGRNLLHLNQLSNHPIHHIPKMHMYILNHHQLQYN